MRAMRKQERVRRQRVQLDRRGGAGIRRSSASGNLGADERDSARNVGRLRGGVRARCDLGSRRISCFGRLFSMRFIRCGGENIPSSRLGTYGLAVHPGSGGLQRDSPVKAAGGPSLNAETRNRPAGQGLGATHGTRGEGACRAADQTYSTGPSASGRQP